MAHFLDAVIKPVKFFWCFFSQKKQTNRKKNSQKSGGRRICQKIKIAFSEWLIPLARWHDDTNCRQQT